jgi:methionyl-tRNA formyltransferase
MRAAVLTSTAPRHMFFLETMARAFPVVLALHQPKKNYYEIVREESESIRAHFAQLTEAEKAEFEPKLGRAPVRDMQIVDEINNETLVEQVRSAGAEVVLLFGTVILKDMWLRAFPDRIVNLHLGLSPFYRGAATLFWPFVNGQLECVGATVHLATERVDAGAILRRVKADPRVGDSYYTLTTRLIRRSIEAMPEIVSGYLAGAIRPLAQDFGQTRAYRMRDFNETVLAQALTFVGAGLTREQIDRANRSTACNYSQ